MRLNLKLFRVKHKLNQSEIAKKIGVTRQTYAHIEQGKRMGNHHFWNNLQTVFNVPDDEMYKLMKLD